MSKNEKMSGFRVVAQFDGPERDRRRYQVQYFDQYTWITPTGPGFRTRIFALGDALAWRASGYPSRVLDTRREA